MIIDILIFGSKVSSMTDKSIRLNNNREFAELRTLPWNLNFSDSTY